MIRKTLAVTFLLLFAAGLLLGAFADKAHAQGDGDGMDRNINKQGMDGLASKKFKTASWPQIAVGVGSIFVMMAVVKWL